jgi:hypothetical protein
MERSRLRLKPIGGIMPPIHKCELSFRKKGYSCRFLLASGSCADSDMLLLTACQSIQPPSRAADFSF